MEPQDIDQTTWAAQTKATIVFADLCGSTGLFENLGNDRATKAVTKLTQWMGQVAHQHRGITIKTLGDGALLRFETSEDALGACVTIQRQHNERILKWPIELRAQIQIGAATGPVVDLAGDCFGDAVNVAARLSAMSGASQIWACAETVRDLPEWHHFRCRSLGAMNIRGKAEPQALHQIEWADFEHSSVLTKPAPFSLRMTSAPAFGPSQINLSWLDVSSGFLPVDKPIVIGRDDSCEFCVRDQNVSRQHCKIEWESTPSGGHYVLTDTSSFGTWVRFANSGQAVELRRTRCTLSDNGEIALGSSFTDFTVPTVQFTLNAPAE